MLKFSLLLASAGVVTVTSPVHAVLLLVFTFCCAAALLLILGVEFLALVYVLVYIGAIAVLFLFIVMMMNLRVQKHDSFNFFFFLIFIMIGGELITAIAGLNAFKILTTLSNAHYYIYHFDNMKLIGVFLYTIMPLSVILIGFILLISMIGSILYTLEHSSGIKRQEIFAQNARNRHLALRLL